MSQLWTEAVVQVKRGCEIFEKVLKVRRSLQRELPGSREEHRQSLVRSTSFERALSPNSCFGEQLEETPSLEKMPKVSCLIRKKVPAARRGGFYPSSPFFPVCIMSLRSGRAAVAHSRAEKRRYAHVLDSTRAHLVVFSMTRLSSSLVSHVVVASLAVLPCCKLL